MMGTDIADDLDDADDPISQWVTFRLAAESYGINVMNIQEVLRLNYIAPVPGAPSWVIGIINLRGNVVPVIDTRSRFFLPQVEGDDSTRIIILETAGQIVGIVVDSVAEVVEVKRSELDSAPSAGSEENARYIDGVISRENLLLILIDVDKLLTDDELNEMAA